MLLNIRGTSGAGKSHLVRALCAHFTPDVITPHYVDGRRQPLYYTMPGPQRTLAVIGHYETACGGCDNIKSVDEAYTVIRQQAGLGHDVLFEGIMIQDDVKRCIDLSKTHPVTVIHLTTPLAECLAGIQQRRDARGDERVLNPKNTELRAKRLTNSMLPRLRANGVTVLSLDREAAYTQACALLGLS